MKYIIQLSFIFHHLAAIQVLTSGDIIIKMDSQLQFLIKNKSLKIKKKQPNQVLFVDYLPLDKTQYPDHLLQARNYAIKLTIIQLVSAIIGLMTTIVRRNRLLIFANLMNIFLARTGLEGSKSLNTCQMTVHCMITAPFFGGLLVLQIIYALFQDHSNSSDMLSESSLLLILSLPYLLDMIAGFIMIYFLAVLIDFNKLDGQKQDLVQDDYEIELPIDFQTQDYCLICTEAFKNATFYDCGHTIICIKCAIDFRKQLFQSCPVCRKPVKDIIRNYQ